MSLLQECDLVRGKGRRSKLSQCQGQRCREQLVFPDPAASRGLAHSRGVRPGPGTALPARSRPRVALRGASGALLRRGTAGAHCPREARLSLPSSGSALKQRALRPPRRLSVKNRRCGRGPSAWLPRALGSPARLPASLSPNGLSVHIQTTSLPSAPHAFLECRSCPQPPSVCSDFPGVTMSDSTQDSGTQKNL